MNAVNFFLSQRLENLMNGKGEERTVAKTMLVLMVRGLCTSLQYPYAQWACKSLKAHHMYRPVMEGVFRLEKIGLKVSIGQGYCIINFMIMAHYIIAPLLIMLGFGNNC